MDLDGRDAWLFMGWLSCTECAEEQVTGAPRARAPEDPLSVCGESLGNLGPRHAHVRLTEGLHVLLLLHEAYAA